MPGTMQGSQWVSLLQRLPPAKHSMLVVVTTTGMELMVQRIFRLEEDFFILRARLAGSSDAGRIILLPYDQLNSIAFNAILPEAEVEAIFGECDAPPAQPGMQADDAGAAPEKEAEPVAEQPGASESPLAKRSPSKPPTKELTPTSASPSSPKISKSLLLARLRARLSGQTASTE
jgi:hypothetical protein